jgi:hypothetical protein
MRCIICNNNITILHTFYEYCPSCFHIQKKNVGDVDIPLKYHCKFFKNKTTNHIIRLLELNSSDTFSNFIKKIKLQSYECYLESINLEIDITDYKFDILYIHDVFGFTYTPHSIIQYIKQLVKNEGRIFIKTQLPNFILNLDSIYISNRLDIKSIFNTNSMKCLCSINHIHLNNILYIPQLGKNCLYEISLQPIDVNDMNLYDVLYNEISRDMYLQDTYTNFINLHSI